jgi:magnesium-transporting ATPase (P-type)
MKAINALVSTSVIVIRDGAKVAMSSHDLVVGDVCLIGMNDKVSADLRLVEVKGLRLDKSALTGESEPVDATMSVLHQDAKVSYVNASNMAFANSVVVAGSGRGVVVAAGKHAYNNKVFYLSEFKSGRNMLNYQRELSRLAAFIVLFTIVIIVVYMVVWATYIRVNFASSYGMSDLFLSLSSIITCFVPFTLPIALTIGLHFF